VHCRECSRKYIREHYRNNKKYYIDKAHKRNIEIRQKSLSYIGSFLRSHRCVDCGETDILVLEFDHKTRSDKYKEISRLIKTRGSLKRLVEEMSKCEVRCANCHRRKSAKEENSWRLQYK
jgi:chorismate-pyruvate lyase